MPRPSPSQPRLQAVPGALACQPDAQPVPNSGLNQLCSPNRPPRTQHATAARASAATHLPPRRRGAVHPAGRAGSVQGRAAPGVWPTCRAAQVVLRAQVRLDAAAIFGSKAPRTLKGHKQRERSHVPATWLRAASLAHRSWLACDAEHRPPAPPSAELVAMHALRLSVLRPSRIHRPALSERRAAFPPRASCPAGTFNRTSSRALMEKSSCTAWPSRWGGLRVCVCV